MAKTFMSSKLTMKVMEDKKAKNSLTLNNVTEDADVAAIESVRSSLETLIDEPFNATTVVQTYDID